MVRKIPFYAAGRPRAQHADQRRLDDRLPVEDLKPSVFVRETEQPAPHLRQERHRQVLVFQQQGRVLSVLHVVVQHVLKRIGIDASLGALIHAAGVEDGVLVARPRRIGRQSYRRLPDADLGLSE